MKVSMACVPHTFERFSPILQDNIEMLDDNGGSHSYGPGCSPLIMFTRFGDLRPLL